MGSSPTWITIKFAFVAELVYAADLESVAKWLVGSSPTEGTVKLNAYVVEMAIHVCLRSICRKDCGFESHHRYKICRSDEIGST